MSTQPPDVSHYAGLTYWGPLAEARMERLMDLMPMSARQRMADVGCGQGELLLRMAQRYSVEAVGLGLRHHGLWALPAAEPPHTC